MMRWRELRQVTRPLNMLNKKGIKYINGEVLKIDPANRSVKTSTMDFTYDYLVIALGTESAPETIPCMLVQNPLRKVLVLAMVLIG